MNSKNNETDGVDKADFAKEILAPENPDPVEAKNQLLAGAARNRINNWVGSALEDRKLVKTLQEGLITGVTIQTHEFRDRDKTQELSARALEPRR